MGYSHGNRPDYHFRRATEADARVVAEVYLRSRKELVACAPLVHSDESVCEWVRGQLIPTGDVTVLMLDNIVVGFCAVSRSDECSWIGQLYVHPAYVRLGIGTRLLDHARNELQPPIRLYTFQCNDAARQFYEQHGFKSIVHGDGSGNEEKCPDILYEWRPE
jgi:ribosomal protein S18 acetylase RimI-like enzyme